MADSIGTIVVRFSSDFSGNKEAICDSLNHMGFIQANPSGFFVHDNEIHAGCLHDDIVMYPTLKPYRDERIRLIIDGQEVIKEECDVTDDEWELNYEVVEEEPLPFSEITSELSKSINTGTLYLSGSSTEKGLGVDSGHIEVNADGTGKRILFTWWRRERTSFSVETC